MRNPQGNSIDCKICYSVAHDNSILYLRMIKIMKLVLIMNYNRERKAECKHEKQLIISPLKTWQYHS